ncbi:hypothetical protein C3B58_15550 [Lactonifactor longoviformis]|uniref:Uncharacterized protein n=1 Tax=Lactonifactor longoviformis DSM 17459 TaxID=1122155 RepID=A0A1M4TR22_9CLOT|nr:hypothetical protein [Lactonifactor longoviformis]POP31632.1 hypothetical protein C3B58_15550 [Lactonifactor longoviformis]SHE46717.1 hypothetical protein SAMN02745158_00544 [Lactonifactor longoviformis DSM 17459]
MAYQAKRSKKFTEDFELVNEEGRVEKTIHVELDADDVVRRINEKYIELMNTRNEIVDIKTDIESNKAMEDAFEKLGRATVNLFEAVFGTEDTGIIVDFYENRYLEMTKEVTPFITKVVIPRLREIAAENKRAVLESYNRKESKGLSGRKK